MHKFNERLSITVVESDNQTLILVNGNIIQNHSFPKHRPGNPLITQLTGHLMKGQNTLTLIGINFGGPAKFQGVIQNGPDLIEYSTIEEGQGMVWNQTYDFLVE